MNAHLGNNVGLQNECANVDEEQELEWVSNETEKNHLENEKRYSKIINVYTNYIEKSTKQNHLFKWIYFVVSATILVFITLGLIAVIIVMLFSSELAVINKGKILLTALGAFVTSVIVIPLTITKYLFNKKEAGQFADFVRINQKHNEKVTKLRKKANYPENMDNET